MDIAGFWKASSRQLSQRKNRVYPEQKQSIEDEEPISYPNGSRPGMPISGFCSVRRPGTCLRVSTAYILTRNSRLGSRSPFRTQMVARPGIPISGFWNAASWHLSPRIYRVVPDQKQSAVVEEPISFTCPPYVRSMDLMVNFCGWQQSTALLKRRIFGIMKTPAR